MKYALTIVLLLWAATSVVADEPTPAQEAAYTAAESKIYSMQLAACDFEFQYGVLLDVQIDEALANKLTAITEGIEDQEAFDEGNALFNLGEQSRAAALAAELDTIEPMADATAIWQDGLSEWNIGNYHAATQIWADQNLTIASNATINTYNYGLGHITTGITRFEGAAMAYFDSFYVP